jgi:hypothetical protein
MLNLRQNVAGSIHFSKLIEPLVVLPADKVKVHIARQGRANSLVDYDNRTRHYVYMLSVS